MSGPIYVYDSRSQYQEPIFIVYDEAYVEQIVRLLNGGEYPDHIYVTTIRLHDLLTFGSKCEAFSVREGSKRPKRCEIEWMAEEDYVKGKKGEENEI
jgi:hypothetical protein